MRKTIPHYRSGERGNIIWFLLLAIVLLGAITMVLSRSGGSVDQSGDVEHNRIQASQLLRYAKSIESAVQSLKLNQNLSENDISFENDVSATDYTNANCSDNFCKVFHSAGAGMTYTRAPAAAVTSSSSEWIFTGANRVGTSADPVGSANANSGNELLILLPNIREGVCTQINKLMEVNDGVIPTDTDGITITEFTGTFSGSDILDGDETPFELDGEPTGCFYDADDDTRYFYHTLLIR